MNDGIIIIHLLMYLQNMIDSGQHKLFYNDLMHDEKVIDIINAITNLQEENDYYFKKNIELSSLNTSLRSDRDDYKSRCEKIRNYVNSTNFVYDEQYKKKDKIENILNGGDKEN